MDPQKSHSFIHRIELLYAKLDNPNYVMNNYFAEAYFAKLTGDVSDPELSLLSTTPIISELLVRSLRRAENYHISVKVFITRLLSHITKKELQFVKMYSDMSTYLDKGYKNILRPNVPDNLRVAYLEVALSLIQHRSGLTYLLETGVWKDILMLANEKKTYFVLRQVYQFTSKFLWALNDIDDVANIYDVLNFILTYIQEIGLVDLCKLSDDDELEIFKKIQPTCEMLLAIFSEKDRVRTSNKLMNCLLTQCMIFRTIGMYSKLRSEDTVLMCNKILFWATLANVFQKKPLEEGVEYTKEDLHEINSIFFTTIRLLAERRNLKLVLEYCNACNTIWYVAWRSEKIFMNKDKKLEMQSQMIFICVFSLLIWTAKDYDYTEVMEDEIVVQNLINMMQNIHAEQTMRAVYAIRAVMLSCQIEFMKAVMHSLKMLACLKLHVMDEQASYFFKLLFYVLKEFDPNIHCSQEAIRKGTMCQDSEKIMTHIMENMLYLVKHFNISWNESLEVLNLYSVVYETLKRPSLPPKFVVVSLNVLTFSVKKFLTPNLFLLMESSPGSAAYELGTLINLKMNDQHWEVRDSALELLFVCMDLSYIKFPPFQKQIMEDKLISIAGAKAFTDEETYVQVSALKCLGAASRVPCIWEQLKTDCPTILEQLLTMLRMNSDDIVRVEACNVLCNIYQNVKLSAFAKYTLYEHMVSSALSDFNWEVQICALKFWNMVIQTLLTEQGMIDGHFPPVTFSRESRKIVTLNEYEIQRRLHKVLNELASIGCLTVLVKLLNEDSETEIMKLSFNISLDLLKILEEHKLTELLRPNAGDPISVQQLSYYILDDCVNEVINLQSTAQNADQVLEEISESDDMNLLSNLYDSSMRIQNSEPIKIKPKIRLCKPASPYLFVAYVKSKDFRAILEHKKKWMEGMRSLSSLLDDILGEYDNDEHMNSIDCY